MPNMPRLLFLVLSLKRTHSGLVLKVSVLSVGFCHTGNDYMDRLVAVFA